MADAVIQSIDGDVCTPLVRTSAETKQMQSCLQRAHTPNRVIFSVAGCIVVKADVIVGDRYRFAAMLIPAGHLRELRKSRALSSLRSPWNHILDSLLPSTARLRTSVCWD